MTKTPLAILLAASLTGGAAFAANTITFHGEVTDSTCQVSINDQDHAVVLLDSVPASTLSAAGKTAGQTTLTLQLSGCADALEGKTVKVKFSGRKVTNGGNLENTATNGAKNVALQLLKAENGEVINLTNGPVEAAKLTLSKDEKANVHTFAVQYIAENGAAENGPVKGIIDYVINYE